MEMHANKKKLIEKAVVNIKRYGGQGVLVPGGYILTAAHCVSVKYNAGKLMGNWDIEEIYAGNKSFKLDVYAAEAGCDIAILGELDNQAFTQNELQSFEVFVEETVPIPIFFGEIELFKEIDVYVYTHFGTWIKGIAKRYNNQSGGIAISYNEKIKEGTSGSPIVNEKGEIIAIVSHCCKKAYKEKYEGSAPIISKALPVWMLERILNAKAVWKKQYSITPASSARQGARASEICKYFRGVC